MLRGLGGRREAEKAYRQNLYLILSDQNLATKGRQE
jgi:hypothetical protein